MGEITDVLIKVAQVPTYTSLYVKDDAPFDLLLGQPWQQQNLVTIDKRMDGTYLVFKDPMGQPEFEYKTTEVLTKLGPLTRSYSARISNESKEEDSNEDCIDIITTIEGERDENKDNSMNEFRGYDDSVGNAADDERELEWDEPGTESEEFTEDDQTDDGLEDILQSQEDQLWCTLYEDDSVLACIMKEIDRKAHFRLVHATVWSYCGYKKERRLYGIPEDLKWLLPPLLSYYPTHMLRPLPPKRKVKESDEDLLEMWGRYQSVRLRQAWEAHQRRQAASETANDLPAIEETPNEESEDSEQEENSQLLFTKLEGVVRELNKRLCALELMLEPLQIQETLTSAEELDRLNEVLQKIDQLRTTLHNQEGKLRTLSEEGNRDRITQEEWSLIEDDEMSEGESISSLSKLGSDYEEEYARQEQAQERKNSPWRVLRRWSKARQQESLVESDSCESNKSRPFYTRNPDYRIVRSQARPNTTPRVFTVFSQPAQLLFDELYEEEVQTIAMRTVSSLEAESEAWSLPSEFNELLPELRLDLATAAAYIFLDNRDAANFPEVPPELNWIIDTLVEHLPVRLDDLPSSEKIVERLVHESKDITRASEEHVEAPGISEEAEPEDEALVAAKEADLMLLQDELSLVLDMSNESVLPWMVMQLGMEVQDALAWATVWTYANHKPESAKEGVPEDLLWMLPPLLTFFPVNRRSPLPEIRPAQETNNDLMKLWKEYQLKKEAKRENNKRGLGKSREETNKPAVAESSSSNTSTSDLPWSEHFGPERSSEIREKLYEDVFKSYYILPGTYENLPMRLYIHEEEEEERGEIIVEAWKRFSAIAKTQGESRGTPMRYSGMLPSSFVEERILARQLPKHRASDAEIHLSHHVQMDEYETAEEWSLGGARSDVEEEVRKRGKEYPTRIQEGANSDLDRETSTERKYETMKERLYATYFDNEHAHDYLLASVPPYLGSLGDEERERLIVEAWGRRVVYLRLFDSDAGLPPMFFSTMLPWSADRSRKVANSVPLYTPTDAENFYANQMRRQEEKERWNQFMVSTPGEGKEEEMQIEEIRGSSRTLSNASTDPVLFHTGLILEESGDQEEHMDTSAIADMPHGSASDASREFGEQETRMPGQRRLKQVKNQRKSSQRPNSAARHLLGKSTHLSAIQHQRREFARSLKRASQREDPRYVAVRKDLDLMTEENREVSERPRRSTSRRGTELEVDLLFQRLEALKLEFFRDHSGSSTGRIEEYTENEFQVSKNKLNKTENALVRATGDKRLYSPPRTMMLPDLEPPLPS